MDAVRIGLSIRALRRRRGWTQRELAQRCRLSGSTVSRIERGSAGAASVDLLERLLAALGARLAMRVLWQGEELDRLLDRDHATIVDRVVRLLGSSGWNAIPEVTFHLRGERGSIDVLAFHPIARALLTIEVKSVVPDVQATLAGIDRKARVAPLIARERDWPVLHLARLLVLPDDRTARRRVEALSATFDRALPARTAAVKRWIGAPQGPIAGVLFLSDLRGAQARQRVASTTRSAEHGSRRNT